MRRTINVHKQRSKMRSLPFRTHKVRKDRKLFTVKVLLLCCSLFTLILMENKIVKLGKDFLKTPSQSRLERFLATYERIEAKADLESDIKESLEKSHQLIFNKALPNNHFKSTAISETDEEDDF